MADYRPPYTPREKSRKAVTDALNGDSELIEPATRRALYAVTTELDEHAATNVSDHKAINDNMLGYVTRLEKSISQLRGLLVTTAVTFVIAIATAVLNLFLN